MKAFAFLAAAVMTLTVSSAAFAGKCELTIDRTPCPGEKAKKATFKPYDGKNPTVEEHTLATDKECTAKGEELAKIQRKGTISKKSVSIKFDGKDLGKKEDASGGPACKKE